MTRFLILGLWLAIDIVVFFFARACGSSEVFAAFVSLSVGINALRLKVDA